MSTTIALTFQIYRGETLEREHTISAEVPSVIKIGKLESAHVRLEDESVSPMHAVIEVGAQGELHITDLSSARGTLLHGQPITKSPLGDGDELVIGDLRLKVGLQATAEMEDTVVSPMPTAATAKPTGGTAPVAATPPAATPAAPPSPAVTPAVAMPPGPAPVPSPPTTSIPGFGSLAAPAGSIPPAGYASAPVPAVDPTIERQDGTRAIEVTVMFNDTVLDVRHLENPALGVVSGGTWGLIGLGAAIALGGVVSAVAGAGGIGGILMVLGCGFLVSGLTRRSREQQSPHFTIGAAVESDLHVSHPAVPDDCFPLVQSTGTDYTLNFTSGMGGDLTQGNEVTPLSQLVEAGRARQGDVAGAYTLAIPQDARIRLDLGDNMFLVNSVPAAQPVLTPFMATVDWSAQFSNGLSLAAHAILLLLVIAIPPNAKSLSLDLFDMDQSLLNALVKPQEEKEEEVPSWLKKGADKAGGKGQRHKGSEGKMGKKTSKKKTGLYGLKGPKDNPDPHLAKELAEEAAEHAGVLGVLKSPSGSHLASLFGRDTALGTDAEDALGGLIGDSIGESYGLGGLGLVGTGRGGGGTGEGTIGLGSLGTIGKGGGGGSGSGYGRGAGGLRGRRAKAPRVLAGQAQVRGSLDKEIIRRIIRRHLNQIRYCYQSQLQADENLGGRIVVQFTIAPTGQVVVSKIQSSTVKNKNVESCIAQTVRRMLFPKPKGGGIVIVSYPFVLRSAGS